MASLTDSLVAASIRNESGLDNPQAGVGSLREFDAIIQARIAARAVKVATELRGCSGVYAWPLSDATMLALFPNYNEAERKALHQEQWTLATDAVRFYVLGDLYIRASQRNPDYINKARLYYEQGREMINAACETIKASITGTPTGDDSGPKGVTGGGLHVLRMTLPTRNGGRGRNEYGDHC